MLFKGEQIKNEYLNLLEDMENLTDSEKRTLLSITTYLNKEELDEFAEYNKGLNISIRDSLKLENTDINNEKIKEVLLHLQNSSRYLIYTDIQ